MADSVKEARDENPNNQNLFLSHEVIGALLSKTA